MRNAKIKIWLLSILTIILLSGTMVAWLTIIESDAQEFNVQINNVDSKNITVETFKGNDYDNNGTLEALSSDSISTKEDYIKVYYNSTATALTTAPAIRNVYSDSKITFKMLITNGSAYNIQVNNFLSILDGTVDEVIYNKYIAIMFGIEITGVTIYDSTSYRTLANSTVGTSVTTFNGTTPLISLMNKEDYISNLAIGAGKTAEIDFRIIAFQTSQMQDAYNTFIADELENYWDAAQVDDTAHAAIKMTLQGMNTFAEMETPLTNYVNGLPTSTDTEEADKATVSRLLQYIDYNQVRVDNEITEIRDAMLEIGNISQTTSGEITFVISNIYTVVNYITGSVNG